MTQEEEILEQMKKVLAEKSNDAPKFIRLATLPDEATISNEDMARFCELLAVMHVMET